MLVFLLSSSLPLCVGHSWLCNIALCLFCLPSFIKRTHSQQKKNGKGFLHILYYRHIYVCVGVPSQASIHQHRPPTFPTLAPTQKLFAPLKELELGQHQRLATFLLLFVQGRKHIHTHMHTYISGFLFSPVLARPTEQSRNLPDAPLTLSIINPSARPRSQPGGGINALSTTKEPPAYR